MAARSIFDAGSLRSELEAARISSQLIPTIWKHVVQNRSCSLDDVPSLPAAAYSLLRSKFRPMTSSLSSALNTRDRVTTKLLIRLQGMGEPLNNYNALVEAVHVMTGYPFQLSPKRVTVSTATTACIYNTMSVTAPDMVVEAQVVGQQTDHGRWSHPMKQSSDRSRGKVEAQLREKKSSV